MHVGHVATGRQRWDGCVARWRAWPGMCGGCGTPQPTFCGCAGCQLADAVRHMCASVVAGEQEGRPTWTWSAPLFMTVTAAGLGLTLGYTEIGGLRLKECCSECALSVCGWVGLECAGGG